MSIVHITNLITIILSWAIECFILIYYSNTVMSYRNSRHRSNLITILGYSLYCIVGLYEIPPLNLALFIVTNLIVFYIGYDEHIGSIAIKVLVLTVLMMFGEIIASMLITENITAEFNENITAMEDIVFSITSKLIYFFSAMVLKNISTGRTRFYISKEIIGLLLLPISTCMFLSYFNKLRYVLDDEMAIMFVILSVLLMITNFVVYIICDSIMDKNLKIQTLQKLEHKRDIDLKSYQMMKEKYNDLKIMVHDYDKFCNLIEGLLNDNQHEALSLTRQLKNRSKQFLLVQYTNNAALNILLTQKMEECVKHKIDFQIYVQNIDLSFIEELDVVSIFANLLDNAIESSQGSNEKKIFMSIYTMNNAYIVIKVDNSSDTEPIVHDGKLTTWKKNKELHGIGMTSIRQALNNYKGNIKYSYDKDSQSFNTTILINYYHLKNKPLTEVAF